MRDGSLSGRSLIHLACVIAGLRMVDDIVPAASDVTLQRDEVVELLEAHDATVRREVAPNPAELPVEQPTKFDLVINLALPWQRGQIIRRWISDLIRWSGARDPLRPGNHGRHVPP